MKVGLFYELQLPRPWNEGDERDLFHNTLDQIELADGLGYDVAWFAEHHFLEEYSHSSAPEIVLGAASQRSKNIRLGHGIMHLTTNYPARCAERAATLDVLSNGRLELGLGEGSSVTELHPFNVRFKDKRDVWEDAVRCMIPMFNDVGSEYSGPHFQFPPRAVVPKPIQKPHPPLWVACSRMETIRDAGRWGMGVLGFQFLTPEEAEAWVFEYYDQYLNHPDRLADYQTNPNIAVCAYFMCCDTDEEAWEKADGASFFEFSLGYYSSAGPFAPGEVNFWEEYLAWRQTEKGQRRAQWIRDHALVGSPATIRERLDYLERMHVDQVVLLSQTGKTPHKDICESLSLFASDVLPEFHAREEAHQSWKQAVLARDLQLEARDTSLFPRNYLGYKAG